MDKNCLITIKVNNNVVVYTLNDYRIATAICNILDNVAEIDLGNATTRPALKYIDKVVDPVDINKLLDLLDNKEGD